MHKNQYDLALIPSWFWSWLLLPFWPIKKPWWIIVS